MRAVNTNVLVRLLTRDDAKQATSAEAFVSGGAAAETSAPVDVAAGHAGSPSAIQVVAFVVVGTTALVAMVR